MNATGNTIKKTTQEKTFFVRCHIESALSRELFTDKPKYKEKEVLVLQVMIISSNGWLMAECTYL